MSRFCLSLLLVGCFQSGYTFKICNCPPKFVDVEGESIPYNMCREKIVLKIDVSRVENDPGSERPKGDIISYSINLQRILKFGSKAALEMVNKLDFTKLYAEKDYTECGPIVLNPFESYIVSVTVVGNSLYFDRCSIAVPADYVSPVQLAVMQGRLPCPNV